MVRWHEQTLVTKVLIIIAFLVAIPFAVYFIGVSYENVISAYYSSTFTDTAGKDICIDKANKYEAVFEGQQRMSGRDIVSFDTPQHHFNTEFAACMIKVGVTYQSEGKTYTERMVVDLEKKDNVIEGSSKVQYQSGNYIPVPKGGVLDLDTFDIQAHDLLTH